MKRLRAFTLIEVLITLTILTIALLAIFKGNFLSLRASKESADVTVAVIAAESMIKEAISKGYPESGISEGTFEEEYFKGLKWKKTVETLELPFIVDLKVVTVDVEWGKGKNYTLQTILSRY
jgi:type II secretion system protein I